ACLSCLPHCTSAVSPDTCAHDPASHALPPIQPQTARTTSGTSPQRPFGSLRTLIYAGTSVQSPRGTGSTTSRELGFAILSSHLSSLWTWQAQGEEKLSHRLKSILAHGRAFVILTAIGGGLAVGVKILFDVRDSGFVL